MSMGNPLISVIMPVYNGEKYLRDAIDSILNQTFTDFEFIILNDGSTDRTEEIILSYDDPRIRYIKNEINLDISETMNKGIRYAKGKYIARMDADDISLPERFERQIAIFNSFTMIQVVFSTVQLINQEGNMIENWKDDINCISQEEIYTLLPKKNCLANPTVMMMTDIIRNYSYNRRSKHSEDYNLWLRMMSDGISFYKIKEPLLKYRIHDNSVTQMSNKERAGSYKKNILAKVHFVLEKIRKFSFNFFDIKVLKYLLLDIFSFLKIFFKDLTKSFFITLGKLFYFFYPKKLKSNIIVFFPRYHMGGAEKVHGDILEAIAEMKPIVIICNKSNDDLFKNKFKRHALEMIDASWLSTNRIIRNLMLGYLGSIINNGDSRVTLFGCYCSFFYDLLPCLKKEKYYAIDLIHAFSPGYKYPAEIYTLPYLPYLSKRVVINPQVYQDFKKLYKQENIDPQELKKIEIIENGVCVPTSLNNKNMQKFNILYVGRCSPEKRVYLIGRIAYKCHQLGLPVEFTLIGPNKECIEKKYEDYCRFVGKVENLKQYYNESHIILITSEYEGFPMVIMEAMTYGIVPIATNVGGIGHHIKNGRNGFLIDEKDEKKIVSQFVNDIQNLIDEDLFKKMSHNVFEYSKNNFSNVNFESKYQKLFSTYVKNKQESIR
ncbi:MAG: glycosyltransferase [Sulfurovum sp.]|nr:glycosyltransferase [Sulfurovum sp.]MDD3602263.1 glycosyltransferase [Sulfurovum sp.]